MKGSISINRFSANFEPTDGYKISINDESSGVRLIDITLTFEQFGAAIGGHVECDYKLGAIELSGKVREHKSVDIPFKNPFQLADEEIDKILLKYEVDGWKAYRDDFKNYHRFGKGIITVGFTRFVEPE